MGRSCTIVLSVVACHLAAATRLSLNAIPFGLTFAGNSTEDREQLDVGYGGYAHLARLLGKDLLLELETAGAGGGDFLEVHATQPPPPRPPTPDAVTVVIAHLPLSIDNRWLVSWMDSIGGSDAAVFADLRPSLAERGSCHNVGYVTFSSLVAASRFMRRVGSAVECGECRCEAFWARPSQQGLQAQVREAVFRRKTAPVAKGAEGRWSLVEKMPFEAPNSTLLGQAFRHPPDASQPQDFTTVIMDGLPDEYTNAHLIAWFERLGPKGLHANFARLIPSPKKGHGTQAVINFDSHVEAAAFIRHVRDKDASPCGTRLRGSYAAVWAPPHAQGLAAQMVAIPNWFGRTLFRDVAGTWQQLRADPFSDVATGLRVRGGGYVRVHKPSACGHTFFR